MTPDTLCVGRKNHISAGTVTAIACIQCVGAQGASEIEAQQFTISGPNSDAYNIEDGRAAINAASGNVNIGGTSASRADDAVFLSSGFVARISGAGEGIWWQEVATVETDFQSDIRCLANAPEDGVLAGGSEGNVGYLVRTDADGTTLWEERLEGTGIGRVSHIQALSDDTYLAVGEPVYRSSERGSGMVSLFTVDDTGALSTPIFYGSETLEIFLDFVPLNPDEYLLLSSASTDSEYTPNLRLRFVDGAGQLMSEKQQTDVERYPLSFIHSLGEGQAVLLRFRATEGQLDGVLRTERIQDRTAQSGTTIDCPIRGTKIAGTLALTKTRFAVATYSSYASLETSQ